MRKIGLYSTDDLDGVGTQDYVVAMDVDGKIC